MLQIDFPPAEEASPEGLVAVGGDLSVARLLLAYRQGIFPWFNPGQPILWWSPDPRAVLYPDQLKISRSLKKSIKNKGYTISMDTCFQTVIRACADPRGEGEEGGTWITTSMRDAYSELHRHGFAHSVEVWLEDELAGGLYGVALGRVFFGESMFSRRDDASKVALVALTQKLREWCFALIDCQIESAHLRSLGAVSLPRAEFLSRLKSALAGAGYEGRWRVEPDMLSAVK